jgi:hypothetical protein
MVRKIVLLLLSHPLFLILAMLFLVTGCAVPRFLLSPSPGCSRNRFVS